MSKKQVILSVLLLAAVLAGVVGWRLHASRPPQFANLAEFESDLMEGVVRALCEELRPSNPSVVFIAFGQTRTSPSARFMARFAGSQPPVRGFHGSVMPPIGQILETSSGRAGLIVQLVEFKEVVPGCFDVRVAFSNLPPGHDRFTYRFSNATGPWTIVKRRPA